MINVPERFPSSTSLQGEVLPANAIIMGTVGLPEGFEPDKPIPPGFVLYSYLTKGDGRNTIKCNEHTAMTHGLITEYGRDNVIVRGSNSPFGPEADIAVAVFTRHDAQKLPRATRLRRKTSQRFRGIVCDVNF